MSARILVVACVLVASGCAQVLPWGRVGMVRRAEEGVRQAPVNAPRAEGQACGWMVMGRVQEAALLSRALRNALKRAGPDVKELVDVEVEAAGAELVLAGYPVLVRRCVRVSGVPRPDDVPEEAPPPQPTDVEAAPQPRPPPSSAQAPSERQGTLGILQTALLGRGAMHGEIEARYVRALVTSALLAPVGGHLWAALWLYPDVEDDVAVRTSRVAAVLGVLAPLGHVLLLPAPLLCLPSLVVFPVGLTFMAVMFAGTQVAWLAAVLALEWMVLPRAVALAWSDALRARDATANQVHPAEPDATGVEP